MDLSGITWLILNEIEGAELSGSKQPEEMIGLLLERYPDMKIILTLGEKGAIYQDRNFRYQQPVYFVNAKDTTVAGDMFTGYVISEVAEGKDLKEALEIASKAAAITVSRNGAGCSIPSMEEIMNYYKL